MRGKGEAVMKKVRHLIKTIFVMMLVVGVMAGMCTTSYADETTGDSSYNIYLQEGWGDFSGINMICKEKGADKTKTDPIIIFNLKNTNTGSIENAYCCDIITDAYIGACYKKINLEDSYLKDKDGYMIGKLVTLFEYCYWTDWDNDDLQEAIEKINNWAKTTVEYKDKAISGNLTKPQAMNASQTAIWRIVNKDDIEYVQPYYDDNNDVDKNNIDLFCAYLAAKVENVKSNKIADDHRTLIFTDDCFTSDETIVTDMTDSSTVTLKFKLKGSVTDKDELKLTAVLGEQKVVLDIGKEDAVPDKNGYYYIEFNNVPEDETEIDMSIEGKQVLNRGVYFYEALPGVNTTARSESQNMIGCVAVGADSAVASGDMPIANVHADKTIKIKDNDVNEAAGGNGDGNVIDNNNKSTGSDNTKDNVSTGDDMHILPFALIMVTAAGVAAVALAGRKRGYQNKQ